MAIHCTNVQSGIDKVLLLAIVLIMSISGTAFVGSSQGLLTFHAGIAYAQLPPGPGMSGDLSPPGSDIGAPGDNASSLGAPGDTGIPLANSTNLGPGYLAGNATGQSTTSAVPEFGGVAYLVLLLAVLSAVLVGARREFQGRPGTSG